MATLHISDIELSGALGNFISELTESAEVLIHGDNLDHNSRERYRAAEQTVLFLLHHWHKSVCTSDECEDNRREMINSIKKRTGCTDYHAGVIIDQLRDAA